MYREVVLSRRVEALVLWVEIFGVQPDGRLRFRIFGPHGKRIFDHTSRLDKRQPRRFVFAGLREKGRLWPEGVYRGEIRLNRKRQNGLEEHVVTREVELR